MQTMQQMQSLRAASRQKGFTIIELVVVILLLGILAATALPRFMDVTEQAHDAAVDGVVGGLATGMALLRAQWFAEGQPTGTVDGFGLGNITANSSGVPIQVGSVAPGDGSEFCVAIFDNVLQAGRPRLVSAENPIVPLLGDYTAGEVTNIGAGPDLVGFEYGEFGAAELNAAISGNISYVALMDLTGSNDQFFLQEVDSIAAFDPEVHTVPELGGGTDYYAETDHDTLANSFAPGSSCQYFYIAQYPNPTLAQQAHVIVLNLNNGEIELGRFPAAP